MKDWCVLRCKGNDRSKEQFHLEETDQVRLRGLLKGFEGSRLEAQLGLPFLGNFTDEPLER